MQHKINFSRQWIEKLTSLWLSTQAFTYVVNNQVGCIFLIGKYVLVVQCFWKKKYVLRWRSLASFMSIFGNILSNSTITCSEKSTSTSAASWRMENSKRAERIYSEFIPWPIFEHIFWFMDKLNEFLFKKFTARSHSFLKSYFFIFPTNPHIV